MKFCAAILRPRWFGWAMVVSLSLPAAAQQQIHFSKPVDPDQASRPTALPPGSDGRFSASVFNAPKLFGDQAPSASFEVLPGASDPNAAAAAVANERAWQKSLQGKKDWTLLTPEQVLGIKTPAEILGITDPNVDPNLTAEQRFIQRGDRLAAAGATNGLRSPDNSYWGANSDSGAFSTDNRNDRFAQTLGGTIPNADQNANPLFNFNSSSARTVNVKSDSPWVSPFGSSQQLPPATPEQLAGMDRFRALMNPTDSEKPADQSRFSFQPATTPDPNIQTDPNFNPAGHSFSALDSGINKVKGLTPLPGITGPQISPAQKRVSLVQPPPWLSDSPHTFTPVQRQF